MTTAPATTPLPGEIRKILGDLEANELHAGRLVAPLDEAAFNWRPDARSWSTAQCLDHMNVSNRTYMEALQQTLGAARRRGRTSRGPVQPGWLERWFVSNLEPPPRRRFPAPKKVIPALTGEKEALLGEFRQLHREIADLLRDAADLDLGVRFPNPFVPLIRFTAWTGFLVIPAHERRHLWQAEQLQTKPGFPA